MTVALWIFGGNFGINPVAAALVGLTILLVTGVTTWKACLSNNEAWNTLTWFAALIAMASFLNKFGFIPWFSDQVCLPRVACQDRFDILRVVAALHAVHYASLWRAVERLGCAWQDLIAVRRPDLWVFAGLLRRPVVRILLK